MDSQLQTGDRRFGLDLLRAVAIGTVLGCHYFAFRFAEWFALGFFGVELFFILSGFLIGGLLLDIADQGPTWREWRVFMARPLDAHRAALCAVYSDIGAGRAAA